MKIKSVHRNRADVQAGRQRNKRHDRLQSDETLKEIENKEDLKTLIRNVLKFFNSGASHDF